MWACLAAMSAYAKDLGTAEIAYAAIDEVIIHLAILRYHSRLIAFRFN